MEVPDGVRPLQGADCILQAAQEARESDMPTFLTPNGLEESFRPRGQKPSAGSIGRTRSGKAAHGKDLKVMGAAPTGDEAGATLLRMIQDSKRIAPSGTRKLSGAHLAGGQEVGTERKRLRISDWITGVS